MVNLRYEIVEQNASSFGGLHAIAFLLDRIKIKELFDNVFGRIRRVRRYHPMDNISFLISSILCGGDRLSDIERLSGDDVSQELFGGETLPCDTTIRDDLLRLGDLNSERRELLFQLNELLISKYKPATMTIDMDGTSTSVEGHQEYAEKGYCPENIGSRCFQHRIISWHEMGMILSIETYPGNTHCSYGSVDSIGLVLDRFAPQVEHILVRLDSGFYSEEMLEKLESYGNVEYEVVARGLGAIAEDLSDDRFKSYHGSEREYGTFRHFMGGKVRVYYVERSLRDMDQGVLFDEVRWVYRIIVSNRSGKQPHKLFDEYNHRGCQEQLICELKSEFALGSIVSGDFCVTIAAAWVSALACTIMGLFRKIALRLEYRRFRMKRIRYWFINIVAKLVKHGGRKILKLFCPPIGQWKYDKIIQRIAAL